MSTARRGTCMTPGPYDYHCSDDAGHRFAHYDGGEDASWTDREEDWPTEHDNPCPDPECDYNTGVARR